MLSVPLIHMTSSPFFYREPEFTFVLFSTTLPTNKRCRISFRFSRTNRTWIFQVFHSLRLPIGVRYEMTKVFPNTNVFEGPKPATDGHVSVLTVWKKSLLFNCNGFTVFDAKGNLVFRVDNYVAGNKGEIVLMDATGKPLLTIRRKRLSVGDNWLLFDGETAINPRFSVKKQMNFLNSKSLAQVSTGNKNVAYEIEGSYAQRSCAVYDDKKRCVAEMKRKESIGGVAFGDDVFRLILQPEIDPIVGMALVISLEQMFRSRRFSP
ncbi:hypothetical protein HHK36_006433 [Tetracentron sinense]|uniref:Protein LURP-one-related 8 n=1 Tax=Tetracentron sinense TaxID=13715 RepID=A0A834ZI16_TETSI|nr:hypothetical protein HHK36_006433 [Tetracentron sinense]